MRKFFNRKSTNANTIGGNTIHQRKVDDTSSRLHLQPSPCDLHSDSSHQLDLCDESTLSLIDAPSLTQHNHSNSSYPSHNHLVSPTLRDMNRDKRQVAFVSPDVTSRESLLLSPSLSFSLPLSLIAPPKHSLPPNYVFRICHPTSLHHPSPKLYTPLCH